MQSSPSQALQYGNWTPGLFVPQRRSIGGIVAQITIEEQGTDELQITDHPVEQGSPISDHAFKRPVTLNINAGWSVATAYDLSAESGVYGLLLSWQAALMPFDVITGKRHYTNMLIERLVVTTDQHSEFALMAQISCRQVIIVGTQTVATASMSDQPQNHADQPATAPPKAEAEKPTTTPNDTTTTNVEQIVAVNQSDTSEKNIKLDNIEQHGGLPGGGPSFTDPSIPPLQPGGNTP
jgi:hypothetical protein